VGAHRRVAARPVRGPRGQSRRPRAASPGTPVKASPSTPVSPSPGTPVKASPSTPDSPSPGTPVKASSSSRLSTDRSPGPSWGAVPTPGTCRISRCRTRRPS